MSGILRLESLTKGNTLKQGDKTPLKYRLFDADGEKLNIAGKSAVARLMYPDFLRVGYESEPLTVSPDNTVTFSIDKVIKPVLYYVEITVDDKYIFPSRVDESKINIDKSSKGSDVAIIEIIGKDVLVRDIKNMVDSEIKPVVDDMIIANQKVLENEKIVQDVNSLAQQLENRQNQVEQFNNQVITEMTDKDVISAPEILGARGGFDTLGERLSDTTAQLAQTETDIMDRMVNVIKPPAPLVGAKGDLAADDTAAILNIIEYCETNQKPILFPFGYKFRVTDTISSDGTINVYMYGALCYGGTHDKPAFVLGNETITNGGEYYLSVESITQSNWENENYIGAKLINLNSAKINLEYARKFTIGWQLFGEGRGFAYNNIHFGRAGDNKYQVELNSNNGGWVNENSFHGGRFYNLTTTNNSKDRYGVRIKSEDGYSQNNNNFYKPSFEIGSGTLASVESIPVIVEQGNLNAFKDIRHEKNGDLVAKFTGESTENKIDVGFGGLNTYIVDSSRYPTNMLVNRRYQYTDYLTTPVINSGNLAKRSIDEGELYFTVPDVGFIGGTGEINRRVSVNSFTREDDYIRTATSWAVGVDVFLNNTKELLVLRDVINNEYGRVGVLCFDEAGNRLNEIDGIDPVKGSSSRYLSSTSIRGGSYYRTQVDYSGSTFLSFREDVYKARIVLESGGTGLSIRSFVIMCKNGEIATSTAPQ